MADKETQFVKKELEEIVREHKKNLRTLKNEQEALIVQEQLSKHFEDK